MRDLEARAVLTPAALPSALMHTLVNTHRMLNCAAFSSDAACLAGEGGWGWVGGADGLCVCSGEGWSGG